MIYFYGEDSNLTAIFANKAPDVPAGYDFDYINADGLIHELSVNGRQHHDQERHELSRAGPRSIQQAHVAAGAARAFTSWSKKARSWPARSQSDDPSLADDAAEFQKLNDELFGDGTGVHTVGKGKVYAGQNAGSGAEGVERRSGLRLHQAGERSRGFCSFIARLADGDIYFLDNRSDRDETVDASFRVTGKAPELWYAETGKIGAGFVQDRGRPHHGAACILNRGARCLSSSASQRQANSRTLPKSVETHLATVGGLVECQLPARPRSAVIRHARQT